MSCFEKTIQTPTGVKLWIYQASVISCDQLFNYLKPFFMQTISMKRFHFAIDLCGAKDRQAAKSSVQSFQRTFVVLSFSKVFFHDFFHIFCKHFNFPKWFSLFLVSTLFLMDSASVSASHFDPCSCSFMFHFSSDGFYVSDFLI